jgi:RNA polymerase sigma-70 factor, ECF subfamily
MNIFECPDRWIVCILIHNPASAERLKVDMASFEYSLFAELATPAPAEVPGAAPLTFAYVFRTHAAYVLGLVRRLGVGASDAEDVAQEVFLAVHAGLVQFEGRSKLKTWICSICLHKVQDFRRQASRRREHVSADPVLVQTDTPHEGLVRKQHVQLLDEIIKRLPDPQRQVFVLYEVEELSMSDIARIMRCPIFTAYGRLRDARREVKRQFERASKARCP